MEKRGVVTEETPVETQPAEMVKKALDDQARVKMREDKFYKKILPPVQITNDDLDRSVSSNPEFQKWIESQKGK